MSNPYAEPNKTSSAPLPASGVNPADATAPQQPWPAESARDLSGYQPAPGYVNPVAYPGYPQSGPGSFGSGDMNASGYPEPPYLEPTYPQPYGTSAVVAGPAGQSYQPAYTPYGPTGYGYMPPDHPQSIMVLILGIVGMFVFFTAPVGWAIGNKARREIRNNPGQYGPSGALTIGWIISMIVTLVYLAMFLLLLFFILVLFAAA